MEARLEWWVGLARRQALLAQRARAQRGGVKGFVRRYWDAWKSILILARRPDDEEFALLAKLSFLGFLIVGGIAYIIRFIAALLSS